MLISGKPFKSRNINFDPYGNPLEQFGSLQSSLGFTGEMTDPNGLLYLHARYATPPLGIFLTRDPVEGVLDRVMSRNGNSYVEGNPVNYTDPSGKFLNFILGAAIGAIGGALIGAAIAHTYAETMFALATQNKCGCERKLQVESMGRGAFVAQIRTQGALFGAAFGAVASLGPLGELAAGAAGVHFGGVGIFSALSDIAAHNMNLCNLLDLLMGTAGVLGGVRC